MSFERVGIIGDVHAEADRLEIALHFLQKERVECILCVGDIVDGQGSVDKCCELLRESNAITVRGNHDRWFMEASMRNLPEATRLADVNDRSQTFIKSLSATQVLETVAGRLLLCHGLAENDMQRLTPDDYGYALQVIEELHTLIHSQEYKFIVNGHTHRRMVRQFTHLTVINVGTLYYAHEPCIALANFRAGNVQFYDFQKDYLVQRGEPAKLQ